MLTTILLTAACTIGAILGLGFALHPLLTPRATRYAFDELDAHADQPITLRPVNR